MSLCLNDEYVPEHIDTSASTASFGCSQCRLMISTFCGTVAAGSVVSASARFPYVCWRHTLRLLFSRCTTPAKKGSAASTRTSRRLNEL